MRTVVFDIEADALLDKITTIWVIAAVDAETKQSYVFTEQDCGDHKVDGTLEDGVKFLMTYDKIVAHNFLGYDYHVLEKFFPHLWTRATVPFSKCWDTFIQSKCQIYDRPRLKGLSGNHGLEYYGQLFKYPKPAIDDWTYWDASKLNRVLVDIEINLRAYNYLNNEAEKTGLNFVEAIRRTQATSYWYTKQELYGTKGDKEHMQRCVEELDGFIEDLRKDIEPLLPKQLKVKAPKCTWSDISNKWPAFFRKTPPNKFDENGKVIKDAYMPTTKVFLKNGNYDKHTATHFGISQNPDESGRLVAGAYTKIEYLDAKMSQHAVIKEYLLSIGWEPTQWNYEKDYEGKFVRDERGKMIPKSPKLTEDSFDSISGDLGEKIAKYNTYVHRRRTFANEKSDEKGWINQLRADGRIASGCMAWSTSTGRAAQRGIVNVPSPSALYGAEMRKSWVADEDKILVSVDMDSAQLRLLANFMGDPAYTHAVLSGQEFDENHNYVGTDPHTLNAQAFGVMSSDMVQEARETQDASLIKQLTDIRKYSKNGIYCYLFGGGDEKLATTLKLKTAAQGKAIKERFTRELPAMGDLQERLRKMFKEHPYGRGGFIQVAGNTWVYCMSEHKLLNYLLMASEAALQNEAVCWLNHKMSQMGLKGHQILSIHDELTAEFPLEEQEIGMKLMTDMYGEASKRLGLDVLVTGTAQCGYNWLEIH
jgi:hypothetical protein